MALEALSFCGGHQKPTYRILARSILILLELPHRKLQTASHRPHQAAYRLHHPSLEPRVTTTWSPMLSMDTSARQGLTDTPTRRALRLYRVHLRIPHRLRSQEGQQVQLPLLPSLPRITPDHGCHHSILDFHFQGTTSSDREVRPFQCWELIHHSFLLSPTILSHLNTACPGQSRPLHWILLFMKCPILSEWTRPSHLLHCITAAVTGQWHHPLPPLQLPVYNRHQDPQRRAPQHKTTLEEL